MATVSTVWTLNMAYDLIAGPQAFRGKSALEVQQELCDRFGNKIRFGQRPDTGNQLMPNREYFVPIAPKCIGGLFDSTSGEVRATLDQIRSYYVNTAKQKPYQKFWDEPTSDYEMQTSKYQGYYEMLRATAPNILIGYSQGGLVCRYLYWLDKAVFKENLISGIITLSSPNFGSPLANPENMLSIFGGLFDILKTILGFKAAPKPAAKPGLFGGLKLLGAPKPAEYVPSYEEVTGFLGNFKKKVNHPTFGVKLMGVETKKKDNLNTFLTTLLDWMGGLRNDPNNAFYDLNLFRMEPNVSKQAAAYSVLASVNQPSGTGNTLNGIISADMKSKDILFDAAISVIIELLENCLKTNQRLSSHFDANGFDLSKANRTITEDSKFDEIDLIYSQKIMHENHFGRISNPQINQAIQWHETGVTSQSLEAHDHDFVIPSAYQLTLDPGGQITPMNWTNGRANHLSGSLITEAPGEANRAKALEYLEQLI